MSLLFPKCPHFFTSHEPFVLNFFQPHQNTSDPMQTHPRQGSTLTHDRPTLSACCSVRSGWTRQIQARLVVLIPYQHSFIYDCKLTFSLVERMIGLDDCLLFYHIRNRSVCVTSPGNPA